jgi:hypothetical protein
MPTTNDYLKGAGGGAATTGTACAVKYLVAGAIGGWFGLGAVAAGTAVAAIYIASKK